VRGKIRLPGGRPAPQGVLVSLEAASSGGVVGQTQSDSAGNFEFTMLQPDLYVVRVKQPGYEPVAEEVDLRTTPTAYLNLEIRPVSPPGQEVMPPEGPGTTISAKEIDIPARARREVSEGKELLEKRKDLGKSVQLFQKAVQEYPKYAEAYLLMGVAYTAQQRWSDASTALNHAIELDSKYAPAYLALGALNNQQNMFADAEKPLLKALEFDSNLAVAHFELARAYWGLGRWQDADPQAHVMMGNILLRKRDGAGALKEFQEALRLAPDSPLAPSIRQVVAKIEAAMKDAKHDQH
jgi:Tfp pilus assembly protein PilF